MNAPATFPIAQHKGEPTPFLGLRSAIERAAAVERHSHNPPFTREWWLQSEREKDIAALRKHLEATMLPVGVRVNSREMGGTWDPKRQEREQAVHMAIAAECRSQMKALKRADDTYQLRFTPIRGEIA